MEKVDQLMEVMAGQAPEVVAQIITYEKTMGVFWVLLSLVMFWIALWLFRKGRKVAEEGTYDSPEVPLYVFAGIIGLVGAIMFLGGLYDLWLVWTMPKLSVLNYIMSGLRAR